MVHVFKRFLFALLLARGAGTPPAPHPPAHALGSARTRRRLGRSSWFGTAVLFFGAMAAVAPGSAVADGHDGGDADDGDDGDDADDGEDGDDKVVVCHVPPGNPGASHTLTIGAPALRAHLGHGDVEGPCDEGDGGAGDDGDDGEDGDDGQGGDDGDQNVTICHRPPGNPAASHTLTIGTRALDAHLAHGDREGPCDEDTAPPVAAFTVACTELACTFNGTSSTDPDGTIVAYAWSFGDGDDASGAAPVHTYAAPGTYTVTLNVTDDDGAHDATSTNLTVDRLNADPVALFILDCSGLDCSFDGTPSFDADGAIVSYAWDLGDGSNATGPTPTHTYAADGNLTVTLTVTDDDGLTDSVSKLVTVSTGGAGGGGGGGGGGTGGGGGGAGPTGGPSAPPGPPPSTPPSTPPSSPPSPPPVVPPVEPPEPPEEDDDEPPGTRTPGPGPGTTTGGLGEPLAGAGAPGAPLLGLFGSDAGFGLGVNLLVGSAPNTGMRGPPRLGIGPTTLGWDDHGPPHPTDPNQHYWTGQAPHPEPEQGSKDSIAETLGMPFLL